MLLFYARSRFKGYDRRLTKGMVVYPKESMSQELEMKGVVVVEVL